MPSVKFIEKYFRKLTPINEAHLKHGERIRSARLEHSQASAKLSQLEDALYVLGMTTAPRTRGRKAAGYRPVRTFEDVKNMVLDSHKHSLEGSVEG